MILRRYFETVTSLNLVLFEGIPCGVSETLVCLPRASVSRNVGRRRSVQVHLTQSGVDPTVVSPGAIWTAADGSDRAELFLRLCPMSAFRSQRPRLEPRNRRMAHIVGACDLGQCLTAVASFNRLAFLVRR